MGYSEKDSPWENGLLPGSDGRREWRSARVSTTFLHSTERGRGGRLILRLCPSEGDS